MLIVAGLIHVKPEAHAVAVEAMSEVMAETRKEAGCISYTFSPDFTDPGLFHLFEEWESQEQLSAHFEAPHIAAFRRRQPEFVARPGEVKIYIVSESRPL
ncbi:MAG: antibiotic biosynthesis monooxygenase [Cytophagales bacterium]|nr:antibiotic biosynthesis monooxygenase [Armatimonadota bacterium]